MTIAELERRVGALEDIEAIKKLHRMYVYALASQQWDDMLDCFAEDGTADIYNWGPRTGKEEMGKLFKGNFEGRILPTHGHFVTQPVITVDGDTASGYWVLYLFLPGPELTWVQGRYDCNYVRLQGQWKFSYMKYTRPWPPEEVTTGRAD